MIALEQFNQITDAEAYFEFFGLDYDPQIVNVNRLHILRKFSQLMADEDQTQSEEHLLQSYRQALQVAYSVFTTSNSVEQKLFKVFQDRPKNIVMLSEIELE
ncbi:nitrogenase-stabilizing/protective protein NifW [Leptolyngbya sp. CCNP1308]|uniref:nitrogenase-stabilizing/protective protein NifW n=1 Tax=Leptolyngbya sp. CCNP1308 TaxID=3110255 RepID=UPI002B20B735|nr:nitrogenase-stabilizing/protective protein NifW [Leptolyngbya sp. CCNP1308]MEA5448089.1 nitrogenase-stabilizing/protective protein NifW [Leptolyngbya sp. CCNP1308]